MFKLTVIQDDITKLKVDAIVNAANHIHQLCDWRWLEGENGKILMQKAGTPTYTATLVKYADMICDKPIGQAKISGITAPSA